MEELPDGVYDDYVSKGKTLEKFLQQK